MTERFKNTESDNDEYLKLQNRQKSKLNARIEKHMNITKSKQQSSLIYAINKVHEYARKDTWATSHENCFRCSPSINGKGESDAHIRKKFESWLEYRKLGCSVFTELILKDGSRPDLIVCGNYGQAFIIEIVESEQEKSLIAKSTKYPFPVSIIRCGGKQQ